MKLHQDRNAFRVLLEQLHERTGYRTDVLEKDYYIVLMLHELAEKQKAGLPAYFKGGTALYKALKTTKLQQITTVQRSLANLVRQMPGFFLSKLSYESPPFGPTSFPIGPCSL